MRFPPEWPALDRQREDITIIQDLLRERNLSAGGATVVMPFMNGLCQERKGIESSTVLPLVRVIPAHP